MISEEVKMIQRDHPSPSFAEADPNTLRPPGAGQTVDPEAVGQDVPAGRMGENDAPTQEGPLAQGVGRVIRADVDVPDTSRKATGMRSPHDAVQEPQEGATSVLEATSGERESKASPPSRRQENAVRNTDERDGSSRAKIRDQSSLDDAPSQARQQFREDMASGKYSTSTIAGGRFEQVIADQANQVARKVGRPQGKHRKRVSNAAVVQMVAGRYNSPGYLTGNKFKQPALNEVAKTTAMNGTYTPQDTQRFVEKVRSLLPAIPTGRTQQQREQAPREDT